MCFLNIVWEKKSMEEKIQKKKKNLHLNFGFKNVLKSLEDF